MSATTGAPAAGEAAAGGRMTLLDVNTFHAPHGGGIRTYHLAKLRYFAGHPSDDYVLVHPGPRHAVIAETANVTRVEIWGPVVSPDPLGYRFMLDYWHVFTAIRRAKPDLIEAGEPWLTAAFLILLKWFRLYRGPIVHFCHQDLVFTHIHPWAQKGGAWRRAVEWIFSVGYYWVFRRFDLTIVTSETMAEQLGRLEIETALLPFGVPDGFLDTPAPERSDDGVRPVRLIYSGRLDAEKGVRLILDGLDRLLDHPRLHLTVIGFGPLVAEFTALSHPRYTFVGYVEGRDAVRQVYDEHDILLATGPYESFGLAVLEGMARGMTVVGSDCGGAAELLRRCGSPHVFRPDDIDDFVRVVHAAADGDRGEIGRRSRAVAESFGTFETAIGRIAAFYRGYLARRAAKRR